ncbi:MAG: hypothetical protein LBS90_06915 [Oscillospiraceae bacterium]|nr:hypothetical protein [Oscillospiraceae bacterium]
MRDGDVTLFRYNV